MCRIVSKEGWSGKSIRLELTKEVGTCGLKLDVSCNITLIYALRLIHPTMCYGGGRWTVQAKSLHLSLVLIGVSYQPYLF